MYLKWSLSDSCKRPFPTPPLTYGKLNRVKLLSFVFLIYVVHGQIRKEQETKFAMSSARKAFSETLDLRSAAHRVFAVQTFSKINDFNGDLCWSARLPDLSVWNFHLRDYFKRRVFQTCSAELHKTKLSMSEDRSAITRHVRVMRSVMYIS